MPDEFSRDCVEHKAIQPPGDQGYRAARGREQATRRTRGAPFHFGACPCDKDGQTFNSILLFGELAASAIEAAAGADGLNRS